MKKIIYKLILNLYIIICLSCNSQDKLKPNCIDCKMKIFIGGGLDDKYSLLINTENRKELILYKYKSIYKDSCNKQEVSLTKTEICNIFNCINNVINNFDYPLTENSLKDDEYITFTLQFNNVSKSLSCPSQNILSSKFHNDVNQMKELLNKKLGSKNEINWLN